MSQFIPVIRSVVGCSFRTSTRMINHSRRLTNYRSTNYHSICHQPMRLGMPMTKNIRPTTDLSCPKVIKNFYSDCPVGMRNSDPHGSIPCTRRPIFDGENLIFRIEESKSGNFLRYVIATCGIAAIGTLIVAVKDQKESHAKTLNDQNAIYVNGIISDFLRSPEREFIQTVMDHRTMTLTSPIRDPDSGVIVGNYVTPSPLGLLPSVGTFFADASNRSPACVPHADRCPIVGQNKFRYPVDEIEVILALRPRDLKNDYEKYLEDLTSLPNNTPKNVPQYANSCWSQLVDPQKDVLHTSPRNSLGIETPTLDSIEWRCHTSHYHCQIYDKFDKFALKLRELNHLRGLGILKFNMLPQDFKDFIFMIGGLNSPKENTLSSAKLAAVHQFLNSKKYYLYSSEIRFMQWVMENEADRGWNPRTFTTEMDTLVVHEYLSRKKEINGDRRNV